MRHVLAGLLLALPLAAGEPSQWFTGTLLDLTSETHYGRDGVDQLLNNRAHDMTSYCFVVYAAPYTYWFCKRNTTWFDTVPRHTVNTEIKFRFEKRAVIVQDEMGRNHRCGVAKRVLNTQAQAAKTVPAEERLPPDLTPAEAKPAATPKPTPTPTPRPKEPEEQPDTGVVKLPG
jgi:hypothetical protein